jgi:hypothetical protein
MQKRVRASYVFAALRLSFFPACASALLSLRRINSFRLKGKHVASLLRGELDLEQQLEKLRAGGASAADVARTRTLAGEVGAELAARSLAPALRTVYYRTAFQLATSNAVRVSLDTQLRMVDERGFAPGAASAGGATRGTGWCRRLDAAPPLAAGELIEFPFAILEIKLQDAAPEWVAELLASGRLVQCTKFSKFLHGARVHCVLLAGARTYLCVLCSRAMLTCIIVACCAHRHRGAAAQRGAEAAALVGRRRGGRRAGSCQGG